MSHVFRIIRKVWIGMEEKCKQQDQFEYQLNNSKGFPEKMKKKSEIKNNN